MKKLFLIYGLLIACITASAQTLTMDKVPEAASHAFRARYPAAQQESWELIATNTYQVGFFNAKKTQTARFDNTGKWMETETEVTFAQVPRAVSNAVSKQFLGFEVQMVSQVEWPNGATTYEVILFKQKENYSVIFSTKGEILKKEAGQSDQ